MQKDLLAELHLPELDLKSIENIVTQNSARLASLIKETNECLNKNKAEPLHFKEIAGSMVSDLTAVDSTENIKTLKQKFIPISSNNGFGNGTDGISHTTEESNAEDKNKSVENIQQPLQKCLPNVKTSPSKKFSETESIILKETEASEVNKSSSPTKEKSALRFFFSKSLHAPLTLVPGVSILKKRNSISSSPENVSECATVKECTSVKECANVKEASEKPESESDFDKESEHSFCVISEVVGNATNAFSAGDETEENSNEASEIQLITPKKTNDITKIKGWRRKQFFVEKPTTIEFYSIAKGIENKEKANLKDEKNNDLKPEEPGNVENAFVCDSLDEFLDREAELKIGYEIPHLYAEFGIKLTRNEIVSKPNLSEEDIQEVETRYCVPVSVPCDTSNLEDIKEENLKGIKRHIGNDTKHCKALKLDENKKQPVKSTQNLEGKLKIERSFSEPESSPAPIETGDSNSRVSHEANKDFSNIKLVNKLIALVVYPGPFMPLHPIVQYHLNKIRSYRTKIDSNWASFAASAVLVNGKEYKRKVLPAYCCAKVQIDSVANNNKKNEISADSFNSVSTIPFNSTPEGGSSIENGEKEKIKLKKCSVVLEKLDLSCKHIQLCMEHSRYNCSQCKLKKPKQKNSDFHKSSTKFQNEDLETVIVSPRACFDKKIANLLAKKVRLLKVNGDTFKSIDCLKTLPINTVEFIKLKFVKESFLSGYLNIWYIKPESPSTRFRAFLTFSHTPPLPNAINLKSSSFSLNNLPTVITEIVSTESTFDTNDYAILHCDGTIWEIHGSLNIAFEKCDKNVEQIFTSAVLPELKSLQEIAHNILRVKAVKWWVLDLTQKFKLMEIKSDDVSIILTRKNFLDAVEKNTFAFMPLRKTSEGRVLGALIMQRLLPFILIGPYYLLETNDLTLKGESSSLPFMYYGEEDVLMNHPLKFFINSVIKNIEKCEKKLEGLWLYDKMCLDRTSYLEVITSSSFVPLPNKYSSIFIEHGYSLNSLTHSPASGDMSGVIKRKDGKEEFKKIVVYLYFDIFELGFVEGELQFDNSVIISHPLDRRTKMKSHKIGDWFIAIIKRRIEFIPKNLVVKWFITKHKDDLRERRPFNKFFLGGAHILTKNGVFYLLEMSDSKMERLGLDRKEVVKAIAQSEVITEVKELKHLSNLLVTDPNKSLSMCEILNKAVDEIKNLSDIHKTLMIEKIIVENKKLDLISCLIKKLNVCRIPFHIKIKIIEKVEPLFRDKKGELNEYFAKTLKASRIGRKYLKRVDWMKILERNSNMELELEKSKLIKTKFEKNQKNIEERIFPLKNSVPAILNESKNTIGNKYSPKYSEIHIQIEKPKSVPKKIVYYKDIFPNISKDSTPVKETQVKNDEKEKIKNTEISHNNYNKKNDKFLKLTSHELPENIKLCWKNWNINKLEVV